ncbi:hypothetical protein K2173_011893 [Erythroxylum novogranatense]|uniref:Pentatricopeptide repeat-containing protein n=1 Tax=Erythroxylum novogranatense TaxID=1862640 RepID=A0AAV8T254_9ROSI|nr:hypothetical protein K2173_011893 [Erythroxylum novogranatense]
MGKQAPRLRRLFHALANEKSPVMCANKIKRHINLCLVSPCKDLNSLLQLHARLVVSGFRINQQINVLLLKSYELLGTCEYAQQVFDSMPSPSVALYNSMIRAYLRINKDYQAAVRLYHCMLDKGLVPDKYSFTFVLKALTGALEFKEGILVHREISSRGLEADVFIGTALVNMYCKIGELSLAREAFDRIPYKDVAAWNAMILGLSQSEYPYEALNLTRSMQFSGVQPNLVTILNLVPAVSRLGDIDTCKTIHGYLIRKGFDAIASNGLIDMYSLRCMEEHDDVSWGTMMAGLANNGYLIEVLELFDCMREENVKLNKASAVSAIMAAAELGDLKRGNEIHNCARQQGIESDVSVATCIITMYAKCKDLARAKELFFELKTRDLVAWSAIIAAFVQSGYLEQALVLFRDMQNERLKPNVVTLTVVLPACAEVLLGKSVHCYAIKANIDSDISIGTALVSMYANCGCFTSALAMFNRMTSKDVITWNALMNGYAQIGDSYSAIKMFNKLQISKIYPDSGTMASLLLACTLSNDLGQGSCIHGHVTKWGFESDTFIKNALIDMYAKCGSSSSAEFVFNDIDFIKDEVSWNVMIAGYIHSGYVEKAISAFHLMKLEHCRPTPVTVATILPAVAHLSFLQEGMTVHAYAIQMGFQSYTQVGNSLVSMYAKCGQLNYSEQVFYEMENKDNVSWNVMITGYAIHGKGNSAIELFSVMQDRNIRIDSVSFLNVLSDCRHNGLVDEGIRIFDFMCNDYQLEPEREHYACMVDLLGRSGLFDETLMLINRMPMEPDTGVWGALMGACIMHSNVKVAEFALNRLSELKPNNPTHHLVLSSFYANSGRWGESGSTRSMMIKTGLRKTPGLSWV